METGERAEPKVVLLVRLLSAIDEGRHSFDALKDRIAQERPPSTRTMRRYLSILGEAGFPWYFDRGRNVYRFTDGYSLRRLNLSSRELFGLVTLKRLGNSLGGTLASAIDEAAGKLMAVADTRAVTQYGDSSLSLRVEGVALDAATERVFETLREAESARRGIDFAYIDKTGKRSRRTVDPYGFIVSNGRIYLVGFDHDRSALRVFAVDNISAPTMTASRFERPADFDVNSYGSSSVSGLRDSSVLSEVVIQFSPIIAKAAQRSTVAQQREARALEDGSIEIVYDVADPLELVRWALGWGGEAQIVAPATARLAMHETAAKIASAHRAIAVKSKD